MSGHHEQIAFSNALRPPDGASPSSASAPPLSRTVAAEQPLFRLDLRRSLLMHRRLALGFALFGLVLAVVYLLRLWFVDTAQILAHIQLTPSGVIRNAMALLLGFIFLGAMAAVVAHKIDPRVYIASDVEHLLRLAPVAQLPDFSEVSHEVAEEQLMRLATWIDSALKHGSVSNCVFTGTGAGAGATTVASRVKESLEVLSRMAVVVTDTAPLTASAETEQLARHADCTIVVIESGVTTRAQLRSAVSVLQRIQAPAVGFVLNRVRLATADRAFRRSVAEMEQRLRSEDEFTDRQMLRTLRRAIEAGRASLEAENVLDAQAADDPIALMSPDAPPAEESAQAIAPEPFAQAEPSEAAGAHDASWQAVSSQAESSEPAQEAAQPALEETAHVTLPRLCELRGTLFTEGLKELDQARRAAPQNAVTARLMREIKPFEPLFEHAEPVQSSVPAHAAQAEPARVEPARNLIPVPESEVAPDAKNGTDSQGNGPRRTEAQAEFPPAKPATPAKSTALRGDDGSQTNRGQHHAGQERGEVLNGMQILPSKQGQYRKKD